MNELKESTSLYLLQHAANPVYWKPYSNKIWDLAREQDKLVLLSIGYSSCHWCHVMEHHIFEDQACADVMNAHFINVKIDKEERPDLDMIYMDAAHIMNKPGGWPLNVICLPNGKPIHVETYVPKAQWISLIHKLNDLFEKRREDVMAYGHQVFQIVEKLQVPDRSDALSLDEIATAFLNRADSLNGGFEGAPKFPMPGLWLTLLKLNTPETSKLAVHTVEKIVRSGIFDHVEGGLFRYTVDAHWSIPHFEKMLYDNAQFLNLLCEVIKAGHTQFTYHAQLMYQFIVEKFRNESNVFGSSFDADCEGKEGAYYTLNKEEIEGSLENELDTHFSHWMEEALVPALKVEIPILSKENKRKLTQLRSSKPRVAKDDKTIAAWNGMALCALWNYTTVAKNPTIEHQVQTISEAIFNHFIEDQLVFRISKNHGSEGFLDDYAWMICGLLEHYQYSLDKEHLNKALSLTDRVFQTFKLQENLLAYIPSGIVTTANKVDIIDHVTPSSNAVLYESVLRLNALTENRYPQLSAPAIQFPKEQWKWVSNVILEKRLCTVKIQGIHATAMLRELLNKSTGIDIAEATESSERITIYVCKNQTCFKPVHTLEEALELIENEI